MKNLTLKKKGFQDKLVQIDKMQTTFLRYSDEKEKEKQDDLHFEQT